MEKDFKLSAYTFFIERYGTHITKFRKNDARNIEFMLRMVAETDKLKGLVSEEAWQHFESYLELMSLHSDIASKNLYGQGIKDGMSINYFLDTEFTDIDFEEIIF